MNDEVKEIIGKSFDVSVMIVEGYIYSCKEMLKHYTDTTTERMCDASIITLENVKRDILKAKKRAQEHD